MSQTQSPPAGWYPSEPGVDRWWDGAAWSAHVRPAGLTETPQTLAQPSTTSGYAIASLVCGLLALVLSGVYVGLVLGIVAVLLGNRRGANDIMSKIGRITGLIAAGIAVVMIAFLIIANANG